MKECGYGVLVNNKPRGIWPLSLSAAKLSAARIQHVHGVQTQVVAVYYGLPVDKTIVVDPLPKEPA